MLLIAFGETNRINEMVGLGSDDNAGYLGRKINCCNRKFCVGRFVHDDHVMEGPADRDFEYNLHFLLFGYKFMGHTSSTLTSRA